MKKPRLLLADDHRIVVAALEKLLQPHYEVVGSVSDGRALMERARQLEPDIVLLEVMMTLLNGLEAAEFLKAEMPKLKLIFLTAKESPELAAEAFRVGASGYVLKNADIGELFQAIEEVQRNRCYVTPLIGQDTVEALLCRPGPRKSSASLTSRQREVLQLLAEGLSMKQAARILEVSPRTIAFHKYRMMEDLGLRNNAELYQLAVRQHIVSV